MSTKKKLMRRTGKCAWQDYKANEDILLEINSNAVVRKIQNYIKRYHIFSKCTERDYYTYNDDNNNNNNNNNNNIFNCKLAVARWQWLLYRYINIK
jgi:hypothetical protein